MLSIDIRAEERVFARTEPTNLLEVSKVSLGNPSVPVLFEGVLSGLQVATVAHGDIELGLFGAGGAGKETGMHPGLLNEPSSHEDEKRKPITLYVSVVSNWTERNEVSRK